MAQVSGIEVKFSADTGNLEKGISKAQSAISGFAKGAAASLAGALSAGAFVAAGRAALNYADNIGKVAQKVGMTTEELSGLNYAAKLSDVTIEQLQGSLGIMARKMGDSADSFQAFGVAVQNQDGTLRGSNEVLLDIADKFAQMPDGVGKAQWAVELFGRSGLDLIPLLNGGSAAIAEATNQARLFGVVISQEAAAGAEQFNDNITKLTQFAQGAVQNFTSGLTPALVNVSEALINSAGSTDAFKVAGEAAGRILEGTARAVMVVRDNLSLLGEVMQGLGLVLFTRYIFGVAAGFVSFAKAVKAAGIVLTAFSAIKKASLVTFIALAAGIAIATDSVDELKKGLDFIYQTAQDLVPELAKAGTAVSDAFGIDLSSLEADLTAARKLVSDGGGSVFTPPAVPGGSDGKDKDKMREPGIYREEDPFFIDRLEAIREQFKTEREILAEEYILNQEVLDNALANKLLSEQEYYELSRKLAEDHQKSLASIQSARLDGDLAAASSFFGSMASVAQAGGKRMLKVAKAAAAAQAIVDTIRAAVSAMNDPTAITPIQKFANYAAVFAKGMSAVAAIKGVSDGGGGGGGGSSGGGGGSGGGMASSGAGGVGAGPTTTFAFTLTNDPMGFGEKFARQFIDQLNSTQRNGGQIRGVIA